MSLGTSGLSDSTRVAKAAPTKLFPFRLFFAIGLLISLSGRITIIPGVSAQFAPSCNASLDYGWSYNSLNQDPCVVATYLGQACASGYSIPSINSSRNILMDPLYGRSQLMEDNNESIMVRLQPKSANGLPSRCEFPDNIPSGTSVPHWAYLNVTAVLIQSEAQAVGDLPESSGTSIPTGSTSTPTPTPVPTPAKKSHSDVGPIAGGVVGGVIFLCLVAIVVIYLRRRRSRRRGRGKAPSSHVNSDLIPRPYPTSMSTHPQTSSAFTGTGFHASLPSASPKLYDPSDPSTFPSSVLTMSPSPPLHHGHSPQGSSETNNSTGYFSTGYHSVMPAAQGRQPGIPEV
ncbi:hypothetical protein BT96DRAFT_984612 [Gymnopus androsaceus JB14]|uniref:Uncharacterized protein n=1 Tax=Gymnopus androsaceus JB14 TaxID=1447944 RepID=A0A6A4IHS7_9AGAR|nr:hypothetical protein BT96DRAFT_984612 [Gymnopus androsaceus JB14]